MIQAEWRFAAAFSQWHAQGAWQIRSTGKRSMQARLPAMPQNMMPVEVSHKLLSLAIYLVIFVP